MPVYTINKFFGKFPIIGDLLVSRKGEGVLGFTYSIEGPMEEARVFVNPLSAFAPGFLRRLFEMGGPKVSTPPDPKDRPATPGSSEVSKAPLPDITPEAPDQETDPAPQ